MRGPGLAILALVVLGGCSSSAATPAAKPGARPSVLLITLDTTRADHLGCYGAGDGVTPSLDALAAQGVRFENALSPAPLTLPAHATLLTGLVPRRHGVRDNALGRLSREPPALAETLAGAGYATAAFVSSAVLDRGTGIARGYAHYDDAVRAAPRETFGREERPASATTRAALAHLPHLPRPFFLWVHYFDPHLPYVPPEPFRSRYPERPYAGEIAFADREAGRLLDAVRRHEPELLVVVAGDHGESLGEHGEAAHGVFVYQATQHVPLLVAGPGVARGRVVRDAVGLVDLAPTLLDLLGLPPFAEVDGCSLRPLLAPGPRKAGSDPPACDSSGTPRSYELESLFPRLAYGWAPLYALVRGERKYVEAPAPELYELAADPSETNNLYPERAAVARPLQRELRRRIADDARGADSDSPETPELAERRRRLATLGYAGAAAAASRDDPIDPKLGIGWLADLDAARAALARGAAGTACRSARRLVTRNPENLPGWLVLVQCRLGLGRTDAALEAAERAVALSPDSSLARFHRANALAAKATQDPEAAEPARDAFRDVLRRDPRHARAYLNFAALLVRGGAEGEARAMLESAREAGVQDPDIEFELGVLAARSGEVAAAEAAFLRAVSLYDCTEGAHEALGRLAYEAGRFAESASRYRQALTCRPSAALARTLGAIHLEHLNDPNAARAAFRQALALSAPNDPETKTLKELLKALE